MRIVSRKEFLALPRKTMFSKMQGEYDSDIILIKTSDSSSYSNDFICKELGGLNLEDDYSMSYDMLHETIDSMHKDSKLSIPMDEDCTYRDGLFDESEKYLIYEIADIKKMISVLIDCL